MGITRIQRARARGAFLGVVERHGAPIRWNALCESLPAIGQALQFLAELRAKSAPDGNLCDQGKGGSEHFVFELAP